MTTAKLKWAIVITTLIGGIIVATGLFRATPSVAMPNYATNTGQACGTCHINPAGGGPRTDMGRAFEAVKTHAVDPAGAWAQVSDTPAQISTAPVSGGSLSASPATDNLVTSPIILEVQKANNDRQLSLIATLRDAQGKPLPNALVHFAAKVDFFIDGLMVVGEATTDSQGVATLQYEPRIGSEVQFVARYEGNNPGKASEATATVELPEHGSFYQPEAGIRMPTLGPKVAMSLGSTPVFGERAPSKMVRLPGHLFSWLLPIVLLVGGIWSTFIFVMSQLLNISRDEVVGDDGLGALRMKEGGRAKSLIPMLGIAYLLAVSATLIMILLTGPYTHNNLLP
ncbi:MAG: Ig-like domain-containing protein [Chloroflexi bacterium]|nr:Ig-like domain-containing protein [Chloroflexota bacterium]